MFSIGRLPRRGPRSAPVSFSSKSFLKIRSISSLLGLARILLGLTEARQRNRGDREPGGWIAIQTRGTLQTLSAAKWGRSPELRRPCNGPYYVPQVNRKRLYISWSYAPRLEPDGRWPETAPWCPELQIILTLSIKNKEK